MAMETYLEACVDALKLCPRHGRLAAAESLRVACEPDGSSASSALRLGAVEALRATIERAMKADDEELMETASSALR